ncbi:hypothetical protein E2562_029410 [Oryza meyeriana var. granulata]|uniref:Uncharacterized protein n=1 Tax=Oryza meyeriana var. granulata TaxID=110450 RepID=A0A6G1C0U2_9ORYZ|nr:hypothetical protein E2562_029410 [Oryza meyeriana var. granulata]KAF0893736.1 hypothetical protein E2562_029410 [Oryza meyeriana var. granulata]
MLATFDGAHEHRCTLQRHFLLRARHAEAVAQASSVTLAFSDEVEGEDEYRKLTDGPVHNAVFCRHPIDLHGHAPVELAVHEIDHVERFRHMAYALGDAADEPVVLFFELLMNWLLAKTMPEAVELPGRSM